MRKQHKLVPPEEYLRVMREVELPEVHIDDLAEHLGVHRHTARRKLDGLIAQGKVVKVSPSIYALL